MRIPKYETNVKREAYIKQETIMALTMDGIKWAKKEKLDREAVIVHMSKRKER